MLDAALESVTKGQGLKVIGGILKESALVLEACKKSKKAKKGKKSCKK
jgi:hypothetical protein